MHVEHFSAVHTVESNDPFFSIAAADGEQRLICISMKAAVFAADSSTSFALNSKPIYSCCPPLQSEDELVS